MSTVEKNDLLLKAQKVWKEECYDKVKANYKTDASKKGILSYTFNLGVSDEYVKSPKKIMIVGQEARGHTHDEEYWCLKRTVDYMNCQVHGKKNPKYKRDKCNRSPFWRFFRKIDNDGQGYSPCWNNIDKVTRYEIARSGEEKERKIDDDDRKVLNQKLSLGQSLLQKEIEIVEPDIVVFAIGTNPAYLCALRAAFGLEKEWGEYCPSLTPTLDGCCREISKILNLDVPTYWTYHPNFLNYHKLFNDTVKKIVSE